MSLILKSVLAVELRLHVAIYKTRGCDIYIYIDVRQVSMFRDYSYVFNFKSLYNWADQHVYIRSVKCVVVYFSHHKSL